MLFKENQIFYSYLYSGKRNLIRGKFTKIQLPCHLRNVSLGDYSYISINSWVSETKIGKFCSIGPNFMCGWGIHPKGGLSTAPMFYSSNRQNGVSFSKIDKIEERKMISIGNDVFIGANVSVLDGFSIGDGAIIGTGAVVSKDIPPYAIAVGVPIKIIGYRFDEQQIEKLQKIQWWNFSEEKLQDVEELFFNIDDFICKYE